MTTPTVEGPATVEAVAGWLSIPEGPAGTAERAHITVVVTAVNAWVAGFHDRDDETGQWPPAVVQGAVMLAARITRRRNSPAGVESFGELGATYVSRYDPDVEKLLGLGPYRPLVVG